MKKSLSLRVLADHWHGCTRCKLSEDRQNPAIVFGYGSRRAKYLFIYDTPSAGDAEMGHPMTGREGDLFVDLLKAAKISMDEIYVTPMVGCWPARLLPDTADKPAHWIDRDPEKEELIGCLPRVEEIIYRIDPLLIFTMGMLPWRTLCHPSKASLEKAVGDRYTAHIRGRHLPQVPYDVIPLLSIRAMVASPSYAHHGPLASTARHIMRGATHAAFLDETRKRDALAAGYGEAQASG
jgi:uracil-DNA glycosylase family 4